MRTAIYVRVSKRDGSQTTENQILQLKAYAAHMGWQIVLTFSEEMSGTRGDRAQLAKMFEAASKRKFDILLFWALDRLTREGTLATLKYLDRLSSYGIKFRSYTEQHIDTAGPWGDAIVANHATLAKLESTRRSDRTKAGHARVLTNHTAGPNGYIGPGRPSAPLDMVQVKRLVESGLSLRKMVVELGFSKTVISRAIKRDLEGGAARVKVPASQRL